MTRLFHPIWTTVLASTLAFPIAAQETNTATIAPGGALTLINVITVTGGGQDELVSALQEALEGTMTSVPGFVSGSVHRSLDGEHVANYAQWRDQEAFDAFVMRLQRGEAPQIAEVFALGVPDFHAYDVVSVHVGQDFSGTEEQ